MQWNNDDDQEPMDPEFMKVLMAQLPDSVREKFEDPEQASAYLRRIDRALRTVGLVLLDGSLGVDPMEGKAVIRLVAHIDPDEDTYQQERELRSMLYDGDKDRVEQGIQELRDEYGITE